MKIVIPCIGSRGDVLPFIALAQGLQSAGHTVRLASHPLMKTLVESYAVPFRPIGPNIDLSREVAAILERSANSMLGLVRTMRFSFDMLEKAHADILALCQTAELVVISAQSAAGKNEADQLGLPYLSVTLMPWAIPWDDPQRPLIKRLAYGAIDNLVSLITTRPLNQIRRRQGLPPVGKEGFTSPQLNLVPVSPAVFTPNLQWEDRHRVVGYWFAQEPSGWSPPGEVLAFLDQGEPPLLISLGSMSLAERDRPDTAMLFIEAIRQVGTRAILQGWEEAFEQADLPPEIYSTGSLPHTWLLPRCTGIVHHGGFGTTSAGLRAGIPALVIPHIADQFYWGQRMHELGVGPAPIRRVKLDRPGLAAGLDKLLNDAKIRNAASRLGQRIRAESGVEVAVRLIEATFAPPASKDR